MHTSLLKGETVTDLVTHIFDTELLTGLTNTESDHKTDFNDYKRTKPETQLFQRAQFFIFHIHVMQLCFNCYWKFNVSKRYWLLLTWSDTSFYGYSLYHLAPFEPSTVLVHV